MSNTSYIRNPHYFKPQTSTDSNFFISDNISHVHTFQQIFQGKIVEKKAKRLRENFIIVLFHQCVSFARKKTQS